MFQPTKPLSFTEFVALIAFMISIVAMSIDIMLPALGLIADDLNVADRNDAQLVVSLLFAGFAVGQLIAGPVSDTLGRKNTVFIGYGVFIVGCLLSLFATGMEMMLLGRVLQGLGAAAPRIVTLAMVRDLYGGRDMARVMSTVMAVFVIVPAAAPVIALSGWHATFVLLIVMVVVSFAWLSMRQPEPLPVEKRRPFSAMGVVLGFREVFRHPAAIGYTLCAGFMFGGFLGYLSSSQQVFQDAYGVGDLFPYYFGVAALALGGGVGSELPSRDAPGYALSGETRADNHVLHGCRLFDRDRDHRRLAAALAFHGLAGGDVFLFWPTFRQHQRAGDGAFGSPSGLRCGRGWRRVDLRVVAVGMAGRPSL